ncbi:hypothetical protein GCM10009854_01980 [Saccharopolyspora halophila]|uniref:DUF397 domain-containing protein n=1 Tax=Saccharopolyspora halophila TaxID=405551 RepID=A0ABN3FHZ5_9PSEU
MTHELHGWRTASHSGAGADCVEVSVGRELVEVRDSEDRGGSVLTFSRRQWEVFLNRLRGSSPRKGEG